MNEEESFIEEDKERDLFNYFVEIVNNIIHMFGNPKNKLETSFGHQILPFGIGRLRLVELVYILIKLNHNALNEQFIASLIFLELFVRFLDY